MSEAQEQHNDVNPYFSMALQAESDLQVERRLRIAAETGLPVELAGRLNGTTVDELKADAEALKALISSNTPSPGGQRQTTTPVPTGGAVGESDAQRRSRLRGGGAEGVFGSGSVTMGKVPGQT